MPPVRLDPWQNIVNVHWKKEVPKWLSVGWWDHATNGRVPRLVSYVFVKPFNVIGNTPNHTPTQCTNYVRSFGNEYTKIPTNDGGGEWFFMSRILQHKLVVFEPFPDTHLDFMRNEPRAACSRIDSSTSFIRSSSGPGDNGELKTTHWTLFNLENIRSWFAHIGEIQIGVVLQRNTNVSWTHLHEIVVKTWPEDTVWDLVPGLVNGFDLSTFHTPIEEVTSMVFGTFNNTPVNQWNGNHNWLITLDGDSLGLTIERTGPYNVAGGI